MGTAPCKKGDWFGKHKDNYLMFEYNIHIRLESLIEMGTFGATIRPTVWSAFLINKNLKPEFGADIEIWGIPVNMPYLKLMLICVH